MVKRLRKPITTKQTMGIISLMDKSRKLLTVLAIIGLLWSYIPFQLINASSKLEDDVIEVYSDDEYYGTTTDAVFSPQNLEIVREIESERGLNYKVFEKIDGTYEIALYDDIIHYFEDGEYKEINNSFSDLGDTLENKANKYKFKLPKNIDSTKKFKLSVSEYSIDWSILDINSSRITYEINDIQGSKFKELANLHQSVKYINVFDGVDLEYILTGGKIKENLILDEYISNFTVSYEISTKNVHLSTTDDGAIVFMNDDDEIIFNMGQLVMFDNTSESHDIDYEVVEVKDGNYIITITPSNEWLQNASYPVIIDPEYQITQSSSIIEDGYVYSSCSTCNAIAGNTYTRVGGTGSTQRESLIKFPIPDFLYTEYITYAYMSYFNDTSSTVYNEQINVYRNLEYFSMSSTNWGNRPERSQISEDYHIISSQSDEYRFDITSSVKLWQREHGNYGFTLTQNDPYDGINQILTVESTTKPMIVIGYIDENGLKSFWDYDSQPLGEGGTGFVALNNGSYVNIRNDLYVSNDSATLSLDMSYSLENRVDIGYGMGWRSNYDITLTSAGSDYSITFGDWEKVKYFRDDSFCPDQYSNEDCYISENGDRSVLVKRSSEYILISSDNYKYHFGSTTKYLWYFDTPNGVHVELGRYTLGSDRIDQIRDENGNKIVLEYNDVSGLLEYSYLYLANEYGVISNYVVKNYYSYQTDCTLNYVSTYKDYSDTDNSYASFTRARYGFDSDYRIEWFENEVSDVRVDYTLTQGHYISGSGYYIGKKISGYSTTQFSSNLGSIGFDYDDFYTIISDHKSNTVKYQFDKYGHTISINNQDGTTIQYEFYDNYSGNTNYNLSHKIASISDPLSSQLTLLENGTFDEYVYGSSSIGGWYKNYYSVAGSLDFYTDNDMSTYRINRISHAYSSLYLQQDIELDAGTYILRGRVKNENAAYNTNQGAFVKVNGTSTSNNRIDVFDSIGYYDVVFEFQVDNDNTSIQIVLGNDSYGYAYFDDFAIETDGIENTSNLIENASFEENISNWYTSSSSSIIQETSIYMGGSLGDKALKLTNSTTVEKYLYQTIYLDYDSGDVFTFGTWLKNQHVNSSGSNYVMMRVEYLYDDINYPYIRVAYDPNEVVYFNKDTNEWQFKSGTFEAPNLTSGQTFIGMRFKLTYKGENDLYIDGVKLTKQKSFEYQEFYNTGLLKSTYRSENEKISVNRDANNPEVIDSISLDGPICGTYIEFVNNAFGMPEEIVKDTITTSFVYDTVNPLLIKEMKVEGLSNKYYKTSQNYENRSQYVSSEKDIWGEVTTFDNNFRTSLIEELGLPTGNSQIFEYDNKGNLTSTYIDSQLAKQDYQYNSNTNLIEYITVDGLVYQIVYNGNRQVSQIKVDGVAMVTNSYKTDIVNNVSYITNIIDSKTYATGNIFEFDFDDDNQLVAIYFKIDSTSSSELLFEYEYDLFGRLFIFKDHRNNNTYTYGYSTAGQLTSIRNQNNDIILYNYNELGMLENFSYKYSDSANFVNVNHTVSYAYDTNNNVYDATEYYTSDGKKVTFDYSFDENMINRLQKIETLIDNSEIYEKRVYFDDTYVVGGMSTRINKVVYYKEWSSYILEKYTIDYIYDEIGNVLSEKLNYYYVSYSFTETYDIFSRTFKYDDLNQIEREDYCNGSCTSADSFSASYNYDGFGNLTSRKLYNYTTGSLSGTPKEEVRINFNNSWDDQASTVQYYENGILQYTETFTYDANGNLTYIDDTRSSYADESFVWEGRQLKSFGGYCHGISYKYNDSGYMTERYYNGCGGNTTTKYILDGSKVLIEYDGTDVLYYSYDFDGSLLGVNINGDDFFYQKNLLGDIIGLYDEDGDLVVKYQYDAWGNLTEEIYDISGVNAGELNPYRYKSYRWDKHIGMYYLGSRFYNPTIGRFINSDGYIGSPGDVLGHNLYAYSKNNPINLYDPDGYFWDYVGDGIGILFSVYDLCANPGWKSGLALGFDVVLGIIPIIPSIGQAKAVTRGIGAADDTLDLYKAVGNGKDTVNAIDNVNDISKTDNYFQVVYEAPIRGSSRSTHRLSANENIYDLMKNDPGFAKYMDDITGHQSTLKYMDSGKNLLNPSRNMVWHHPIDKPGFMQLVYKSEHQSSVLQKVFHPSGYGGFHLFY